MLHSQKVLAQYKTWRSNITQLLKTASDEQWVIVTTNGMPVQVQKHKSVIVNRVGDVPTYSPNEAIIVAQSVRVKGLPCAVSSLKSALQSELEIVQSIIAKLQAA